MCPTSKPHGVPIFDLFDVHQWANLPVSSIVTHTGPSVFLQHSPVVEVTTVIVTPGIFRMYL